MVVCQIGLVTIVGQCGQEQEIGDHFGLVAVGTRISWKGPRLRGSGSGMGALGEFSGWGFS